MRHINPNVQPGTVPALSLWQPWASLLVWATDDDPDLAVKVHETRGWATSYHGPIVVHAAKRWNTDLAQTCLNEPFRTVIERHYGLKSGDLHAGNACRTLPTLLPFAGLIGLTNLVDCIPTWDKRFFAPDFIRSPESYFGDFSITKERFAFPTRSPISFDVIPWTGQQGWFNIPITALQDSAREHLQKIGAAHVSTR